MQTPSRFCYSLVTAAELWLFWESLFLFSLVLSPPGLFAISQPNRMVSELINWLPGLKSISGIFRFLKWVFRATGSPNHLQLQEKENNLKLFGINCSPKKSNWELKIWNVLEIQGILLPPESSFSIVFQWITAEGIKIWRRLILCLSFAISTLFLTFPTEVNA